MSAGYSDSVLSFFFLFFNRPLQFNFYLSKLSFTEVEKEHKMTLIYGIIVLSVSFMTDPSLKEGSKPMEIDV